MTYALTFAIDLPTELTHFLSVLRSSLAGVSLQTWGYAALAAFGAFLVASNLGLLQGVSIRLPRRGANVGEDIQRMTGQASESPTLLADLPLLDRAVGPLIYTLVNLLPKDDLVWVEDAIDRLDRPSYFKSSANFYAARVLFALTGCLSGLALAAYAVGHGLPVSLLFACPALGGVFGYVAPKQALHSRLARRRDAMLFEAPYMFDRLAVNFLAENNLPQGLIKLTSVAEGGYLMRELRQVADDYLKAFRFEDAVAAMARRNADVPIVVRFCERLIMADQNGSDLLRALTVIGARARAQVENRIRQNGAENQALLIVPTMIALAGVFLVIGVPMIRLIGRAL